MNRLLFLLALPLTAQEPRFEKDVLPVFTQYCFTCHGQSSPKLGLDLRTAATALRGSHNGPVIVKGKPEESLLWQKVQSRAMPPSFYNQKMPDADMEIIRKWIAAGAPFDAPIGAPAEEAAQQRAAEIRQVVETEFGPAIRQPGVPALALRADEAAHLLLALVTAFKDAAGDRRAQITLTVHEDGLGARLEVREETTSPPPVPSAALVVLVATLHGRLEEGRDGALAVWLPAWQRPAPRA